MSRSAGKPRLTSVLRNWLRIILITGAVLGLITAATLAPALSATAPLADFTGSSDASAPGGLADLLGGSSLGQGSNFGALNPGDSTGVGQSNSDDSDDSSIADSSRDTDIHFTARPPQPMYWRTGAYTTYTGDGWDRDSKTVASYGELASGRDGQRIQQEITLEQSATSLPVAWKPESVKGAGTDLEVTENGGIQAADGSVDAGTTYMVTSTVFQPSPATLRDAGTGYPEEIERAYTQTPDSTPDRVGEFTADLTAEADNPYEKAVAVESWLKGNKEYSLDAGHKSGADVADQFIYEMDVGYCEYFATSMVVMLRSQDVPARYVVGYSPGTETDENTYAVRGMDAHAWVEVYFPDEGWVRFDPTPASSRQETQQEELAQEYGEERTDRESDDGDGFGFEFPFSFPEFDTSPQDRDDEDTGKDENGENTPETLYQVDGPYTIDLEQRPAPGRTVTVSVTKGANPVAGVVVEFNGDAVGTTDERGEVAGEVPYTSDLDITVRNPSSNGNTQRSLQPRGAGVSGGFARVQYPSIRAEETSTNSSTKSFDLSTDVEIAFSPAPVAGESSNLTATIDGEPVRSGTVLMDGEGIGHTNAEGVLPFAVPDDARESITMTVERGDISTTKTIPLADLEIDTSVPTVIGVPGQTATVTVFGGTQPVEDAEVAVDGEHIGTTNEDGEVTVPYDWQWKTTLTASAYGKSTTESISLGLNAMFVAGIILSPFIIVGLVLWRRGISLDELIHALRVARQILADAVVTALVATTDRLTALAASVRDIITTIGAKVAAIPGLIGAQIRAITLPAVHTRFHHWLHSKWAALVAWIQARTPTQAADEPAGSGSAGAVSYRSQSDPAGPRQSIREAWRSIADRVGGRRWETETPGELARRARDAGLPGEPVNTLTRLFRDVEYGQSEPDDTDVEQAVAAAEELEQRPAASGGDD